MGPRRWIACLAGMLALVAGCAEPAPRPLDQVAEAYVQVALQIAQHQPSLVDAYTGPSRLTPGPRVPVAELAAKVTALEEELATIGGTLTDERDQQRARYLEGQVRALELAARRLGGELLPFARAVDLAFGLEVAPPDPEALAAARAVIDGELPGKGSLFGRYGAYRREFVVPPARVQPLMRAAIDACRAATAPHADLPGNERVRVSIGGANPLGLAAVARYAGDHETSIELTGAPLDVPQILRLACHESYPGHHLQHLIVDDALVRDQGWVEFTLSPVFGPHLLGAEGAADAAVDLALPADARARLYRETLLPLAGLDPDAADRLARIEAAALELEPAIIPIVAAYLDDRLNARQASLRLNEEALLLGPEAFLASAERLRARVIAYPEGRRRARAWFARHGGWTALPQLIGDRLFALE